MFSSTPSFSEVWEETVNISINKRNHGEDEDEDEGWRWGMKMSSWRFGLVWLFSDKADFILRREEEINTAESKDTHAEMEIWRSDHLPHPSPLLQNSVIFLIQIEIKFSSRDGVEFVLGPGTLQSHSWLAPFTQGVLQHSDNAVPLSAVATKRHPPSWRHTPSASPHVAVLSRWLNKGQWARWLC